MKGVFDTNIIIDYFNGVEGTKKEFSIFEHKFISIISYMEVLVGLKSESEIYCARQFLANFEIVNVDSNIADLAILQRKKYRIKVPDAIILATAIHSDALLVTRDLKDFSKNIPIIRAPNYNI